MRRIAIATAALSVLAPTVVLAQQPGAPGLTRGQLDDADLVDAQGREIGEVEKVLVDDAGDVTGLVVEIEQRDPTPDKLVQIPLTGLTPVPERGDPDDVDLRTNQTTDQLLAMPAWTRP